jgi:peptidoglycan LD-endopeptidase CwlK
MELDNRSLIRLSDVHDDLKIVIHRTSEITDLDFIVTEGLRTEKRQRELVAAGASQTMNSRHLTGHAVDLAVKVGREVRWDWPLYHRLAADVKEAAYQLGIPIECGADWKKFRDGPHFQLPWDKYP